MSKIQTFSVTLTFSDDIVGDDELMEIANNVARAIQLETNGLGISPADSDSFTTKVEVTPQFLDETVTIQII